MKFWQISFVVDNGATHVNAHSVVVANSREDALSNFYNYMNGILGREDVILVEKTKIEEVKHSNYGVIYQNYKVN